MNSQRFNNLWSRCAGGGGDPEVDNIYNSIVSHYNEPHRFYHAESHIDQCLKHVDKIIAESGYCDIVELAIWFHDVIYEIGSRDNEQRSADWFSERAKNSLPSETIEQVYRCIMSTTHKTPPMDPFSKLVVDIDLSGFGQDWITFLQDGEKIRKENSHMSSGDYAKGQIAFMKKLLSRESIYSTECFYTCYEEIAQSNINRQLDVFYKQID